MSVRSSDQLGLGEEALNLVGQACSFLLRVAFELRLLAEGHKLRDAGKQLRDERIVDRVQQTLLQRLVRQQRHNRHLLRHLPIQLIQCLDDLVFILFSYSFLSLLDSSLVVEQVLIDRESDNHIIDSLAPLLLIKRGSSCQDVGSSLVLDLQNVRSLLR